jgi:hypothetical protein
MTEARPAFFDLLSEDDKLAYDTLSRSLSSPTIKNRRNQSISVFQSVIGCIRSFVVRNNGDEWKRSLVCGMCFFDNTIAINNHNLRFLTSWCKSSINGLLQSMGYNTLPPRSDPTRELVSFLPPIRGNFAELRKWTVRQKPSQTAAPVNVAAIEQSASGPTFVTPPPDLARADGSFGTEIVIEVPKEMSKFGELADDSFVWDDLCFFQ